MLDVRSPSDAGEMEKANSTAGHTAVTSVGISPSDGAEVEDVVIVDVDVAVRVLAALAVMEGASVDAAEDEPVDERVTRLVKAVEEERHDELEKDGE